MKNKTLTTKQAMRYSRQIMLRGFDLEKQEQLMSSKALIIGMGGLGCSAAQYLAAAGIGRLTIVDDDVVELTNLQRQILHFETNVGSKKVESARHTIKQINSQVEVNTIDSRLNHTQLETATKAHDIVIDCSDNLATRNAINDVCFKVNRPLVSGAAIRMEGQIFCAVPSLKSVCYRCISHFFSEQHLTCVEAGVMSPVVGIIGANQANEAIKLLTNFGTTPINKLQLFDAMTSKWQTFEIRHVKDCPTCSSN